MNNYSITKAMIDTTVAHGIREMEEDPHRSVRRLADIGRRFSRSGFHEIIFSVIQELLSNDNSAYYDMVANLIRNSDKETLKTYGVNTGYMSWTYGAREIRKRQAENGQALPVSMHIRFDPSVEGGFDAEALSDLIRQGTELGIYTYYIRQMSDLHDDYRIISMFDSYRDCAFTWMRPSGRLTAAQIQLLQSARNVCTALPLDDTETYLTIALMRSHRILCTLYGMYNDETMDQVLNNAISDSVMASEAALCFLIREDGASVSAYEFCKQSRLKQELPCLLIDELEDAKAISRLTVQHPHILELGPDGTVLQPAQAAPCRLDLTKPLAEELAKVMPLLDPAEQAADAVTG